MSLRYNDTSYCAFIDLEVTMYAINIKQLDEELIADVSNFISSQQHDDAQFVAWLGFSPDEINQQLLKLKPSYTERCWVATLQGEICGFVGAYTSEEQSVIRILGPYVASSENFLSIAKQLIAHMMDSLPSTFKLMKIAFYEANTNCNLLFEANGFELYNAEKTLILEKCNIERLRLPSNDTVQLSYYKQEDYESFVNLHPTNAYYSANEVIERLNAENQLILAKVNNQAIGYVYYELLKSDQFAEICFLNVNAGYRSKGIGSILVGKAVHESFKNDWIQSTQISVRVENKKAESLYTRIGFTEKNTIFAYQRDLENQPWETIR